MFCKKPPALIGAEAREIAEEAARRGLTLACNFQLRQYFEFQHLPKCQAERLLGDIYHIGARFRRRQGTPGWGSFTDKAAQGGGVLLDLDGRMRPGASPARVRPPRAGAGQYLRPPRPGPIGVLGPSPVQRGRCQYGLLGLSRQPLRELNDGFLTQLSRGQAPAAAGVRTEVAGELADI